MHNGYDKTNLSADICGILCVTVCCLNVVWLLFVSVSVCLHVGFLLCVVSDAALFSGNVLLLSPCWPVTCPFSCTTCSSSSLPISHHCLPHCCCCCSFCYSLCCDVVPTTASGSWIQCFSLQHQLWHTHIPRFLHHQVTMAVLHTGWVLIHSLGFMASAVG